MHTRSGVALIANDMHLDLGVPAVWYPARLRVTGESRHRRHRRDLARHAGSGRGIQRPGRLGIHQQLRRFRRRALGQSARAPTTACVARHIAVQGDDDRRGRLPRRGRRRWCWMVRTTPRMMCQAANACRPRGLRPDRKPPISDCSPSSARAISMTCWRWRPRVGIPGQNWSSATPAAASPGPCWVVCRATAGPDRLFGALEFRDAIDHPRIADPPVGRLWTANQRVVDGPLEAVLGDDEVDVGAGGYDIGARARQIRDDLLGLDASGHRGRHAGHSTRFARAVPGALARSAAGADRRAGHAVGARSAGSFASW